MTPDPSWSTEWTWAYGAAEAGLDLARLATFGVITALALVIFLAAIASVRVLAR